MKHKHSHEVEFSNGSQVAFHVADGLLTFVGDISKQPIPVGDLPSLVALCTNGTGKTTRGQGKRTYKGRKENIPRNTRLRWNKKWRTDPSTTMEGNSMQRKVTAQCYKLAQTPIVRGAMQRKIAAVTGLPEQNVANVISHLLHQLNMLEVVK
jgi:hypothetical protein